MLNIVLRFDDGRSSVYENAFKYMKTKNIPGVAYVIGKYLDQGFGIKKNQLHELMDNGWEIGYHSYSHDQTKQWIKDKSTYEKEFDISKYSEYDMKSFCFPYSLYNEDVLKYAHDKGFTSVVGEPSKKKFNKVSDSPQIYYSYGVERNQTFDVLKKVIDSNIGTDNLLILCFHHILTETKKSDMTFIKDYGYDPMFYDYNEYIKLIDYLDEMIKGGTLKVIRMKDLHVDADGNRVGISDVC